MPDYSLIDEAKSLLRGVFEHGDLSVLRTILNENTQFEGFLVDHAAGQEEIEDAVAAVVALIESPSVAFGACLEDGKWASLVVQIVAQSADTGAPVMLNGIVAVHGDGEKINAVYNSFDWIGFFENLSLMPPNTALHCVSGEKLALTQYA